MHTLVLPARSATARPLDDPCDDSRVESCGEAQALAHRAVQALVAEALLTPKPALVDLRGRGAHHDLDLACLLRSAESLRASFRQMAQCAAHRSPNRALREELGQIGREAEHAMLRATGGANAHRGAIWCLGLLVAASAVCAADAGPPSGPMADRRATALAHMAARIARLPDRFAPVTASHGRLARARYGVLGARGEAESGFPHVIQMGLPALRRAREQGASETCAQLDALLAIMEHLPDTCLLHRGGPAAMAAAQQGARAVRAAGGTATPAGWRALLALDAALLARWASPGGAADLLAACLFLDAPSPNPALTQEASPSWSA